jgi:hypothetical protein
LSSELRRLSVINRGKGWQRKRYTCFFVGDKAWLFCRRFAAFLKPGDQAGWCKIDAAYREQV